MKQKKKRRLMMMMNSHRQAYYCASFFAVISFFSFSTLISMNKHYRHICTFFSRSLISFNEQKHSYFFPSIFFNICTYVCMLVTCISKVHFIVSFCSNGRGSPTMLNVTSPAATCTHI